MLASLLPGLRELRTPLAAGYLWLVFVFLVSGSPTSVEAAPSQLQDLATAVQALGKAAPGIAVSFIAYLIGSVSQDVFGRFIPVGSRWLAELFEALFATYTPANLKSSISGLSVAANRYIDAVDRGGGAVASPADSMFRNEISTLIEQVEQGLRELQASGASESEKPEALRPMVEAEESLRLAIVPPIVAMLCYLSLEVSYAWALGLLFATALYVQAAGRRYVADRLAKAYSLSPSISEIAGQLREVTRAANTKAQPGVLRDRLSEIDFRTLSRL